MSDLSQRIKMVMSAVFGISENDIGDDAAPNMIKKWDSLGHMNLITALEEEFEIRFTDKEMVDIFDLNSIYLLLNSRKGLSDE